MCDVGAKCLRKRLQKERKKILRLDKRKQKRREVCAYKQSRRAAKHALVPWANIEALKELYKKRIEGYQLDHIIPLHGKLVSGLHIVENLQYLSIEDNFKKGNTFVPYREQKGIVVEYYEIKEELV